MTAPEIENLVQKIVDYATTAETFAGIIDPALQPFIVIGQAIEKQIPGVAAHVAALIEGSPPTDDEVANLKGKLAVLGDPNQP